MRESPHVCSLSLPHLCISQYLSFSLIFRSGSGVKKKEKRKKKRRRSTRGNKLLGILVLVSDELCCVVFYVVCVWAEIGTLGVYRRGVLCWVMLGMYKSVECDVGIVGFQVLAWSSSVFCLESCLGMFCLCICMFDAWFLCKCCLSCV